MLGLVTALLTAFYMTRQVIMVFYGKARWQDAHEEHGAHGDFTPHESPIVMLFPLVVLAGLSIVGGLIQMPSWSWIPKGLQHRLEGWLEPVVSAGEHHLSDSARDLSGVLALVAIAVAVTGIIGAVMVYAKHKAKPFEPQILAHP